MFAACIPAANAVMIMNFQGHILDAVGPPVIAQIPNSPVTNNQLWSPIPLQSGNYEFTASPFLLAYAGAANAGPALFAQAVALPNAGFSNFEINCINNTAGYIIESTSGAALTGWPMESGSTITPVTFETLTNRPEQAWSFIFAF